MLPDPYIFGHYVQWYPLWLGIARISILSFLLWHFFYKKTVQAPPHHIGITIICFIILGYTGARLFSSFDHFIKSGKFLSFEAFFNSPGHGQLRWYGALLFLILGMPLIKKIFHIKNMLNILDIISLGLCLFTTIVKQACFFSGDGCYGTFTSLPWGMYFPYGAAPNILPVHPTPLYDSLFHLVLFISLYRLNNPKRKKYSGQIIIYFFFFTSLFNILIEFIRINATIFIGLTLSQVTYIAILFITGIYYYYLQKRNKHRLADTGFPTNETRH